MQRTAAAGQTAGLYNSDFALWVESQATALRGGQWADLDIGNLTEEVEGLIKRDRREVRSRLTVLAVHLLKLQFQPEEASRSWPSTIKEQAAEIRFVIEDSPSLRRELPEFVEKAYAAAREKSGDETGLPIATFPEWPSSGLRPRTAGGISRQRLRVTQCVACRLASVRVGVRAPGQVGTHSNLIWGA